MEEFRQKIPKNLLNLADVCQDSLYIVGGSVRDVIAGFSPVLPDWDLASPCDEASFLAAARTCNFTVCAVYSATGTVKLKDETGTAYEFTRFRSDRYVRGMHVPAETCFTRDMEKDALRRDFRANAVYYDLKRGEFCDPLGGIADIQTKTLRTVAPAEKVFGEDGLRLLRLARIAAQTGFSPDKDCLAGARRNRALIRDIVPERIFAELSLLLGADQKHGFREGPYRGLTLLQKIGVLGELLPELALGEGMSQPKEFHRYDVLEHSLRCVLYAPAEIRFAALLHDAGKPVCMLRDGNFYAHAEEGARIARATLTRLKAPSRLIAETERLVLLHMRDFDLRMKEKKVRREIIENYSLLPRLFALRQADYSACKDDLSPAPGVRKWKEILKKMEQEGAPRTLSELAVDGRDVRAAGIPPAETGDVLRRLLDECALNGVLNRRERLLRRLARLHSKEEKTK